MTLTTAFLRTPKVLSLDAADNPAIACPAMSWRQNQLLITVDPVEAHRLTDRVPALRSRRWFEDCLKHSPVTCVRLDMELGEERLKDWANACDRAQKRACVHLPTATYLPKLRTPIAWRIKRLADWMAAAVIVALLSPLLGLLAAIVYLASPGPVFFRQWRVGYRGQLFQIIKFRTMQANAEKNHHQVMGKQDGLHKLERDPRVTRVGGWLRKYSLDELPQLLNVLRGEMSLVGPRPLALYDAMRVGPGTRKRLNALPGMTGFWQIEMRSNQRNIDTVSQVDIDYLRNWSLVKDFRILLLTFPKVLKGSGAF